MVCRGTANLFALLQPNQTKLNAMQSLLVFAFFLALSSFRITEGSLFYQEFYTGSNCENSTLGYVSYELGDCHQADQPGTYIYYTCDGSRVTYYECTDSACTSCTSYDDGPDNACGTQIFGGSSIQTCLNSSSTLPAIEPTDAQVIQYYFSNTQCKIDPYQMFIYDDGVCLTVAIGAVQVTCHSGNTEADYWSCFGTVSSCQDSSSCIKHVVNNAECVSDGGSYGSEVVCTGSWVYGGNNDSSMMAASLGLILLCLAALL